MYATSCNIDKYFPHFSNFSLREKCPYLELFWSVFSRIRTKYGEIRNISPYSVPMRGNTEQNSSEYGHFLRSDCSNKIVSELKTSYKVLSLKSIGNSWGNSYLSCLLLIITICFTCGERESWENTKGLKILRPRL